MSDPEYDIYDNVIKEEVPEMFNPQKIRDQKMVYLGFRLYGVVCTYSGL